MTKMMQFTVKDNPDQIIEIHLRKKSMLAFILKDGKPIAGNLFYFSGDPQDVKIAPVPERELRATRKVAEKLAKG